MKSIENHTQEQENHNCQSVIAGIMELIVSNSQYVNGFVNYNGYFSQFDVTVNTHHIVDGARESVNLLKEQVYLHRNRYSDNATPLAQLLALEDKLIEVIANEMDKCEVPA
ncbi:hypothetical protein IFO68_21140 [Photobacterium sp. CAU 1568]|uniref:Uncharacterized protein n=1 Tax=Photobacterium arenosum TaxID=2774143 RepID=A0ABR9BRK7_9GAMM|nr:hypothetical protein [Photobacterium arenosum]MBD8515189.1 hypothetical protein [Photobacterium arenosum]